MQFALGSVLKLMGSAFGGLGSFRVPSIRRALPVLLGGLLCAVGSSALAQTIESVQIVGTPGADQTYSTSSTGNDNTFNVVFTYDSTPGTRPNDWKAQVQIGTKVGTTGDCGWIEAVLSCPYTVEDGDLDTNGVSVNRQAIVGTGQLSRQHEPLPDQPAHKVDGLGLGIESVTIISDPGADGAYVEDDLLEITFTFTEEVQTVGGNFTPQLSMTGDNRDMTRRRSSFPTKTLTYTYEIQSNDNAPRIAFQSFGSGDLTISDVAGNTGLFVSGGKSALTPAAVKVIDGTRQRIDTKRPTTVDTRRASSDEDKYGLGDKVNIVVEFDEPVVVTGKPTLEITVGTDKKLISYLSGSGTHELTYQWTVPGDVGGTGETPALTLQVPDDPHRLGSGTIKDAAGNNAALADDGSDLDLLDDTGRVDSRSPKITPPIGRTCPEIKIGTGCIFTVTFDEALVVTSETSISLGFSVGSGSRTATYLTQTTSGGTTTLSFSYTFSSSDMPSQKVDASLDIGVPANGLKSGGGLADSVGNKADRKHVKLEATSVTVTDDTAGNDVNERADTTAPSIASGSELELLGGKVSGDTRLYGRGSKIGFAVTYDEDISYSGTVEFTFSIGSLERKAKAVRTSGRRLIFEYSVKTGEDGSITRSGADIVLATGASVKDKASKVWEDADPPSGGGTAEVDTTGPAVSDANGVQITAMADPNRTLNEADGKYYYGAGDKIQVTVTMTEKNNLVVEGATLSVGIGSANRLAKYTGTKTLTSSEDSPATLRFEYRVASADEDVDGISIAKSALRGTIKDDAGNPANLDLGSNAITNDGNHPVLGSLGAFVPLDKGATDPTGTPAPAPISSITQSSSPGTDGFLDQGQSVTFTVTFKDEGVDITGSVALALTVGGDTKTAPCRYTGSTGVKTMTCTYTVASGDEGNISVGALSGGTIKVGDRDIQRSGPSVSGLPRVDARAPELETLEFMTSAGSDGTYVVGDRIDVRVRFSEAVVRASQTTDPTLSLMVGGVAKLMTLQSPSTTAPATADWLFRYTVVVGDNDTDGVSIAANAFKGQLQDAAGNSATITHAAKAADSTRKVDTKGPEFVNVSLAGEGKVYREGDTITATVTYDEAVDVTTSGSNAVRLQLIVGATQKTATYKSGDGSNTLTFEYVVKAGDSGPLRVPREGITGTVKDAAGNAATNIAALVEFMGYSVDARAPMLVGAPSITSSPASGSTYVEGETIRLQVRFDEAVVVTGEPRLPMMVGERLRNRVLYSGGSGTDALTFSYTVLAGDMDDDGVSVAANSLRLTDGATIKDVSGLSVASEKGTVSHAALSDQPGHKVDAVAPGIESVVISSSPASGDAYLIGEVIELTVTFSEDVAVSGSPMLGIVVGTGNRDAMCAQGGDMAAIACSYTVVANDFDADGVSVEANSLSGGSITDVPGNAASLTHDALADDPAHKVYAARPEVVGRIQPLSMAAGGASNSIDLADAGVFTGFQLTYSAVSDNTAVATAQVSGTMLSVTSGMEGTATVTVTATNLAGEASTTFGVIVATDPLEKAVLNDALAAIGRSMLSSTANVIGSRFELAATGAQSSLGGVRFGGSLSPEMQRLMAGGDPFAMQDRLEERALFGGSGSAGFGGAGFGGGYGLTADRLLSGTSFNMPLNALGTGGATSFAIWGAGDLASFEGEPDDGMYDGSASAGFIGVDARGDGWLAGVSVSRSGAEADYTFDGIVQGGGTGGTLETSVTAFHPYARLEVGPDSEVWVIGGFGGGEADLSRTHVAGAQSSDLSMSMVIGGLRRALALEFGGADLSLRGDAGVVNLETDSGAMAIDGLSASASRLRLGLEAAWEGESATPFVEVSGRFDGGDGQTGGGIELAGGIRVLSPETGFGLEAKGRVLAMHTGEGYSESGIGVTASFEPGGGTGITFRVSPRWGGSADSTDLFWDEVGSMRDASEYAYGLERGRTWGVDAALGYGFGLRSVPGLVTPFGQVDVSGDQDQRIRVGVRYGLMQGLMGGTQVEVSAERVDGEMYRAGETRMLVTGRARF